MIRTQVYLSPHVYAELKQRAEKHGLTLALQIREALEAYIRSTNGGEEEPILDPNDPIFDLIRRPGQGPEDLAENHDKHLYRDPHREESRKRKRPPSPRVSTASCFGPVEIHHADPPL
jgi:hypothetical protein